MNLQDFVAQLQKERRRLYHFTDKENLPSIRRVGLVPTAHLAFLGIVAVTGGDDGSLAVDRARGFDQSVRLSFCEHHPMSHVAQERGGIKSLHVLNVCPSVLLLNGVRIADRVATSNDAVIGDASEMIEKIDFDATYRYLDWKVAENHGRRLAAEKWEILIPAVIPPALLGNVDG
ncbi:DarT ssDNA thymidine ADP-ribosyltransferase family protein [Sphingomonas trueperi]|uniref:DarT ssDNA thymidine ADP-ribosyltransferase family protein n=1 Tax=Sphingomonas trueperi TaxID=53317 RepID=UPI0016012126